MNRNGKIARKRDHIRLLTVHKHETMVESCLDSNSKERRDYLVIDSDLTPDTLKTDIKNGAVLFESLLKGSGIDLDSRVTVLRSRSEEDLLKAVSYLSAIHNGFDSVDIEKFVDENCADDEEPGDYENLIPIIRSNDLQDISFSPFGSAALENSMVVTAANTTRRKRYFDYQKNGPVIVVLRCTGFDCSTTSIRLLDEFSTNRRVYLCCVEGYSDDMWDPIVEGTEIDNTISSLELNIIMRNDAAVFRLDDSRSKDYLVNILEDTAFYHGVKFEKDFNKRKFIEKLTGIIGEDRAYMIDRLVYREGKRSKNGKLGKNLFTLIGKFDDKDEEGRLRGWQLLDSLVGMNEVKRKVRSYVDAQIYAAARRTHHAKAAFPNVLLFVGPPGVAKTTVAEALTDIFFESGILPGKRFISLSGAQLEAPYLGQTAARVHDVFSENDLIFLDEAYSVGETESLYAREALAQLCIELEEATRRLNKIIILAGYGGNESDERSNKMWTFLNANPGIKSRIGSVISFKPYSPEECEQIVYGIAKSEGYEVDSEMRGRLHNRMIGFFEKRVHSESFGNGRECRNLFTHASRKAAERTVCGRQINELEFSELKELTVDDFLGAMEEMEDMELSGRGKAPNRLGFAG